MFGTNSRVNNGKVGSQAPRNRLPRSKHTHRVALAGDLRGVQMPKQRMRRLGTRYLTRQAHGLGLQSSFSCLLYTSPSPRDRG